jgi:hypothetical protein
MTITIADLRAMTGLSTTAISDIALTECLLIATDYCAGYCTAQGVGTGGTAYDAALQYMTLVNVWRTLDAMGIKPANLTSGSVSVQSDTQAAIDQWMKLAENALQMTVKTNASSKRDMYMRHLRSGKGI